MKTCMRVLGNAFVFIKGESAHKYATHNQAKQSQSFRVHIQPEVEANERGKHKYTS